MVYPVVSTDWLNTEINKVSSDNLAVLDATWFSNKNARDHFLSQHISCASYIDVFWGVQNTALLIRNIPDAPTFQTNATDSGVNANDHIIIYENTGKFGFFLGARAWWMFKLFGHENVSVLNGGLERWIADGYETTDIPAKKKKGSFTASYNPKWIKTYDDMVGNLSSRKAQVCDSRSPELFSGSQDDPKSGHYPGAVNIPFSSLFDNSTRTLKTVEELKKVYSDAGIDLNKPVIGTCRGGMSSCSLVLTAHMCGCTETAVFLGGFNEWKMKADPSLIAKS